MSLANKAAFSSLSSLLGLRGAGIPSPESLLERESSRSRTEVDEVEMFLKEKEEAVEEVDSFLLKEDLSLKEKRGRGDGEEGIGEADEGHSEKIPESRWLSSPPSLKRIQSGCHSKWQQPSMYVSL